MLLGPGGRIKWGAGAAKSKIGRWIGGGAADVVSKAPQPKFAPGKWLSHFEKHGAEFGYKTSVEYLKGARALISSESAETFTRANGDRLFYDAARNEFAAVTSDGVIRTYFRPTTAAKYWKKQIGGR